MPRHVIDEAWAAVCADAPPSYRRPPAVLEVTGARGRLPSSFAVEEVAVACVGAALLAAAALSEQRAVPVATVVLDRAHVAAAVRSERFFATAAQGAAVSFAPLSRFFEAADGWVRTHANYPWHRRALLSALGTPDDTEAVGRAIAGLPAEEVEEPRLRRRGDRGGGPHPRRVGGPSPGPGPGPRTPDRSPPHR